MRIALCLTGQPKHSMFCFPYVYDAFINNSHTVDVFIYSWNDFRASSLYKPKRFQIENEVESEIYIENKFNLKEKSPLTKTELNIFKMFFCIKGCFDLVDSQDYDVIIRSRLDLIFSEKINLDVLLKSFFDSHCDLYIPRHKFNTCSSGVFDQLAFGTYDSMKKYSNFFEELGRFFDLNPTFRRTEDMLCSYLREQHLVITETPYIDFKLTRGVKAEFNIESFLDGGSTFLSE